MKIEIKADDSPTKFKPFELPIVFRVESVEDAERLHALFNTPAILQWLGTADGVLVRDEIQRRLPGLNQGEPFWRLRKHLIDAYV